MQSQTPDASTLLRQAYLIQLKKRLVQYARGIYDSGYGGTEAVEQYKVTCHLIKKAKNLGELMRIARDMNLALPQAVKLILHPLVDGIEQEDLAEMPETW